MGYLGPGDTGSTPVTLFGHPLGVPADVDEAETLLRQRGLAVLAEPRWLDGAGDEPVRVHILAADPTAVVVARADFDVVSHDAERHRLPVPTDRLRPLR